MTKTITTTTITTTTTTEKTQNKQTKQTCSRSTVGGLRKFEQDEHGTPAKLMKLVIFQYTKFNLLPSFTFVVLPFLI